MNLSRIFSSLAFVAWLAASVAGMTVLWNYEARPGVAASAPEQWPLKSNLLVPQGRSTLLVWLHPHCPCSRATVAQLDRLLVHIPKHVDCQVILTLPPESDIDFVETALTQSVRQLPVTVFVDNGQQEAVRFGVATSGQALLYGADARLLFAGGITAGRGHEGDNPGASKLRELFDVTESNNGSLVEVPNAPSCCVFGCELFAPEQTLEPSP